MCSCSQCCNEKNDSEIFHSSVMNFLSRLWLGVALWCLAQQETYKAAVHLNKFLVQSCSYSERRSLFNPILYHIIKILKFQGNISLDFSVNIGACGTWNHLLFIMKSNPATSRSQRVVIFGGLLKKILCPWGILLSEYKRGKLQGNSIHSLDSNRIALWLYWFASIWFL